MGENPNDGGERANSRPSPDQEAQPSGICMVGIGASAGGLEPLRRLLAHIPLDTGFAFVLVQHLDPTHRSGLSEILGRATKMPVADVQDGALVEPNHVYVIPPNARLTVQKHALKLGPRQHPPHLPIDHFLRSLARDCGSKAIGVILSGAGSDGSLGVQAIKEAGGITFAQEPGTAEFPSMPQAAEATGSIDFVLTPEQIALELGRIARNPNFGVEEPAEPQKPDEKAAQFHAILKIILQATSIDFSLYRERTIQRRILRRLALRNIKGLEEYAKLLDSDPGERAALQRDLLIGVTSFFRDPEAFEGLKTFVFPALVNNRPAGTAIRIWVPGCATGEEAYSIAISLHEYLTETGKSFPVQIFASDISEAAIEKARAGKYPENIAADVTPERLNRYFTKSEEGYQIGRQMRDQCVFSRHNLLDDPPFSKLDLISCRNVLIYLGAVQKDIIPMFHYALRDDCFLLLGRSEGPHFEDLFSTVNRSLRIYSKKRTATRRYGFYPRSHISNLRTEGHPASRTPITDFWSGVDMTRTVDRMLLSKYTPAGVLVDEDLRVLEIRGETAPFLKLPKGKTSLHLLKLLPHTGLFLAVEKLIHEAIKQGRPTRREHVQYEAEGRTGEVNIEVTPLRGKGGPAHLIIFEPVIGVGETAEKTGLKRDARTKEIDPKDDQIEKLKQELEEVRERLLSAVEDYQIWEEENQSTTEEALSANEELLSLNEELETAKEELQSTNEELVTVVRELEAHNVALTQAHGLATAIVEAVSMPLIVLDRTLRIRTVNTAFARAFRVSARDAENQEILSFCGGSWDIPGLRQRLDCVLSERQSFEGLEVEREFPQVGRRVMLLNARCLDSLDMALLAVDDITLRREAEKSLHESEERLRQAQKMEAIGRLAGGIAHDFNNLLTAILGYSHLAADSVGSNHPVFDYAHRIESACNRAAALTDQLLAFSRRKLLQPKVFDLNLVVADFERMLLRLVGERIRIDVNQAADVWRVRADPGEIGRVVMNLCLNARDAMIAGGTLTISTANHVVDEDEARLRSIPSGRYVVLEVRDTGIGMDQEMQSHLFEPFFTTKDVSKGTGLGLATVLGIVEQSGGAISCNSELGKGTVFRVLLPAAVAELEPEARPAGTLSEAPRGRSEVILLVEDDDSVRTLTRMVLEQTGYVVLDAKDGRAGLSVCETFKDDINLLVSDVVMPEMGGRELAERALALRPALKVLFVSGHTEDIILKEGLHRGKAVLLQKPFSPVDLARKVREVLDAKTAPAF
jgi:two-component system CheB/CheR fusion protein